MLIRSDQHAAYKKLREHLGGVNMRNLDLDFESERESKGAKCQRCLRPSLSRRQRRRRYEDVYWANVHLNAVKARLRRRKRADKAADRVLAEFTEIASQEGLQCVLATIRCGA